MKKILSGRFLFTVISAITFSVMSIKGQISPDDSVKVIMLVAMFYFTRQDRKQ